jgi:3-phenylpropionate/trans-cinnamate dioxygenase ferredoxin reductase subunit
VNQDGRRTMFDFRPKVPVQVAQTGESYPCALDESLLQGMLRLGRKGIPVGCVNGGCGVCKVRIVEGTVKRLGPVSRAHVSAEEEARGITLACRVAPECAVRLEVAGKLEKPFSRGAGPVQASPQCNPATGDR